MNNGDSRLVADEDGDAMGAQRPQCEVSEAGGPGAQVEHFAWGFSANYQGQRRGKAGNRRKGVKEKKCRHCEESQLGTRRRCARARPHERLLWRRRGGGGGGRAAAVAAIAVAAATVCAHILHGPPGDRSRCDFAARCIACCIVGMEFASQLQPRVSVQRLCAKLVTRDRVFRRTPRLCGGRWRFSFVSPPRPTFILLLFIRD